MEVLNFLNVFTFECKMGVEIAHYTKASISVLSCTIFVVRVVLLFLLTFRDKPLHAIFSVLPQNARQDSL